MNISILSLLGIFLTAVYLFYGWFLVKLYWAWFIVPVFALTPLTYWQAAGICIVVGMIRCRPTKTPDDPTEIIEQLIETIIAMTVSWGIAWLVHLGI